MMIHSPFQLVELHLIYARPHRTRHPYSFPSSALGQHTPDSNFQPGRSQAAKCSRSPAFHSSYARKPSTESAHDATRRPSTPTLKPRAPYFNAYLLQAMARMGRRREALDWMRQYWGGMLAEGATSFWEAYDLGWSKQDPHLSLQADGVTGYFVSLAHGWSSGPAAWLMEEVLGIHAAAPGFRKTIVRPDLLGLDRAKGQVPAPQGPIRVEMRRAPEMTIDLNLPPGVEVTLLAPLAHPGAIVLVNGGPVASKPAEQGARASIVLRKPGHYKITSW